ncbi:transcription termination/antitermination protein NusG [Helicobacter magdeburgensis]|uniref:Transcription termination/antitermination protein NusG n=3 Tax=Helicobacter TaxID=209 RepID=A0A4V6I1N9_9HELI|nr:MULTISPECIES: transcription termination/antitermination protein NusG [Helicobacter]AWK62153.1 transcription termination/antitermination protein NusG [Helicobacter cinaedi]EFR45592.1 transcription termination/antitermination factor NusG [Helicobacter cinaedi CCUG 18818 = ATCC BAA-847]QOQ91103.1 transcription termination/antitermination protein NusG [Helicobacter cinaedi]QOQ95297.1 transcription termination/antitermination protein NusG [Helicobacter cinaedi]TLD92892.1 transcription terminatio
MEWYAIQTYSGSEKSVGEAIRNLIVQNQMQDRFGEVVVPTESIIETKKKIVDRSLYPGYVFIQVDLDTKLWHMIQSLPRVGRFIGESKKPTPLSEADIAKILEKVRNPSAPKPKISFEQGEVVRIIDGPFVNFTGTVEEYDLEHKKLKLNVSIFGRNTPVEILYSQVEKIV